MTENMKKIPINEIRPSKNPVRQTRDEEKIKELAQSISEKGVLQPIKVRPVPFDGTTKYEIVFGARRWEAAGLVELETIPVIIEQLENDDAFAEGLIENVQRDNMEPLDEAKAYEEITIRVSKGRYRHLHITSVKGFCKIMGIPYSRVQYLRSLLRESKEVQELTRGGSKSRSAEKGRLTPRQINFVRRELGKDEDKTDRTEVLKKVAREGLNADQARTVAKVVKETESPEHKAAILESSYEEIIKEPTFIKAKTRQKQKQQKQKVKKQQEFDKIVKTYLEAIQTFNNAVEDAILAADYDKFSPEAKKFTVRKNLVLIENIKKLNVTLGEENE